MWAAALILVPLLALLQLRAEQRHAAGPAYVLKPLTVAGAALLAYWAPEPVSSGYQAAVLAGLACSLVGDIFLMLPRNYFLRGLVSFLLAHLCYIGAFVSVAGVPRAPLAGVAGAVYMAWVLPRLWPRLGKYRGPVAGYTAVLVVMAAAAGQLVVNATGVRPWLALAGALLFVVSDTVLALDRFEAGWKRRQLLVLATYFCAQWLIAASVTRL
ncbi:MAG: lysoplasmalogenase [Gemmatimonadetes bacterium]|nr:lysoplasmalogenase [Gemmatimonadota bacterium]